MKIAIFLGALFASYSLFAQTPVLKKSDPVKVSKNFNSGNYIVDYLISEDATVNISLRTDSSEAPIYFFKQKFINKGQYELEINKRFFEEGNNFVILEWNGNVAETVLKIEPKEQIKEEDK